MMELSLQMVLLCMSLQTTHVSFLLSEPQILGLPGSQASQDHRPLLFDGALNVDATGLQTNVEPYRCIHFMLSSYALLIFLVQKKVTILGFCSSVFLVFLLFWKLGWSLFFFCLFL